MKNSLVCFGFFWLSLFAFACASQPQRYPEQWWTPVSAQQKPDWEILPQEAHAGEVILSKRNELGLLSNFAATPFDFEGTHYASVEGFWQMMKFPEGPTDPRSQFAGLQWRYTRQEVSQMTAFDAKRAGDLASHNMEIMNIDWVTYKGEKIPYHSAQPGRHYELILAAEWAKVKQNPNVKDVLLKTGHLVLRPDHLQDPKSPPEWHYEQIWMEIREKLQTISQDETPRP